MAKVFGLHMIRLKPGVKPEDFEKFAREEVPQIPMFEGWKAYVLKGLRGDREGKYLMVMEVESVEALNRFAPGVDEQGYSEEGREFNEAHSAEYEEVLKRWEELATNAGVIFTDYVVVE